MAQERGLIVPIGGAEEKLRDRAILTRFVEVTGGRSGRLVVIPTASKLKETGRRYKDLFRELGVEDVEVLRFARRRDADREDWLELIRQATGVFFTGGSQLRLSTILGGTVVTQLLRERNLEGLHIGGTSAGAAFLPEHMIAGGRPGRTPRADMVQLSPGLGLSNRIVVDQHFRQRGRLGRLLTALSYNPRPIGIGLDEDTAVFLGPDDVFEVVGSGGVTVVDATELEHSSVDTADEHAPISVIGLRMHVLVEGGTYDLGTLHARAMDQASGRGREAAEED